MKTILPLLALILILVACNSNEKIQLRAPQKETLETKNVAADTLKLDSAVVSSAKN